MKEKDRLKKDWKRYNQKLSLLFENPDFQKDIREIRKEFGLPVEGIADDGGRKKFEFDLYEKQDKFYREEFPKYRDELNKLQKDNNFVAYKNRSAEINNYAPLNRLGKVLVPSLIKKYNLTPSIKDMIRSYICHGDRCFKVGLGIIIESLTDEDSGQGQVKIIIQEDTTLEDIKHCWSDVKFLQSKLRYRTHSKFQPIRNLELYKRAYQLKQEKSYKQVAEILTKESNDRVFGITDVQDFVKRYKKHIGINRA